MRVKRGKRPSRGWWGWPAVYFDVGRRTDAVQKEDAEESKMQKYAAAKQRTRKREVLVGASVRKPGGGRDKASGRASGSFPKR